MLLHRKAKAGVLLYALLMSAVFSLLLQFYLNRTVAAERQYQAQNTASQAFLMAELTRDLADSGSGTVIFTQGKTSYKQEAGKLEIQVQMANGKQYHYYFLYKKQSDKEQKTELPETSGEENNEAN